MQAFQQKGHAKGFPTLCFMDTTEIGSVITCDGVQKVMADEYGLTMPYRSPIQNVKRIGAGRRGRREGAAPGIGRQKTKQDRASVLVQALPLRYRRPARNASAATNASAISANCRQLSTRAGQQALHRLRRPAANPFQC